MAAVRRAHQDGRNVKAVYPVHLNGQLCDMPALRATASELRFVEEPPDELLGRVATVLAGSGLKPALVDAMRQALKRRKAA